MVSRQPLAGFGVSPHPGSVSRQVHVGMYEPRPVVDINRLHVDVGGVAQDDGGTFLVGRRGGGIGIVVWFFHWAKR